jgi:hypothetical protein
MPTLFEGEDQLQTGLMKNEDIWEWWIQKEVTVACFIIRISTSKNNHEKTSLQIADLQIGVPLEYTKDETALS